LLCANNVFTFVFALEMLVKVGQVTTPLPQHTLTFDKTLDPVSLSTTGDCYWYVVRRECLLHVRMEHHGRITGHHINHRSTDVSAV
jgi:hypothetical protein